MYNENKVNKRVEQRKYLFENCCQVNSIRYQLDCTLASQGESPTEIKRYRVDPSLENLIVF